MTKKLAHLLRSRHFYSLFTAFLACVFMISPLHAEDHTLLISNWLASPAAELTLPVFYDTENTSGDVFKIQNLLDFDFMPVSGHDPLQGGDVFGNADMRWHGAGVHEDGFVMLQPVSGGGLQAGWIAAYIRTDRYLEASIDIESPNMLKAWVNGESIGTKTSAEKEGGAYGKISKNLKLERGRHLLLVKTLKTENAHPDWKIKAVITPKAPFTAENIQTAVTPEERKNIYHIMDGVKISSVRLSPDGAWYSVSYSQSLPPSDQSRRWTEIKRTRDKKLIHSFRHSSVSQITWLPNSSRLSYTFAQDGKTTLYLHDIETGGISVIMEDVKDFAGYRWTPDEKSLVYTIREPDKSADADMRRVHGMQDRQGHFRARSFLYRFDLASNTHTRLTYGNLTTSLHDISPDSKQILFSQSYPDYEERPFSRQNMFILNLADTRLDTLWTDELFGVSVRYSPDGKSLLATGGPYAFGGIGKNVPEGVIANDFDTQGFIYDLKTGAVSAFTKDFDPSIGSVYWHAKDNHIYLNVTEEDFSYLYRYDIRRGTFSKINTGFDFISSVSFADHTDTAVFTASRTNAPSAVYTLNLSNLRHAPLENTEAQIYRHVQFGEIKNWDFTASSGVEIKGRVYYPPDFDAEQSYPVIVYYYAGTSPVGRTFGGRYPFNLWAGSGYIVYVLQPGGAVGFGQAFSAAHVNNWGKTVADEIIEGTEQFLKAHPYADAEKVGCAGASYGGFMTMLLMTRTDLFAAAISHAGISSLSSYWGIGYWGYSYSAGASAGSYPWNNHDLYVGQSPLFYADRIHTPLLLITGADDTNVPPGESIQLYTALKILGRPVELIKVKGEDHHILTYNKRILWHKTLMAWWDKYLKDQPEWWEAQYPEKNY